MLDAGKTLSNYPVMAPFGMPVKALGSLATKYGSYLSTVAERNAAAQNAAANPNATQLGVQSSRVRDQLRSNEGYGDGPGNDRFGGVIGTSGVTAGVGERGAVCLTLVGA